jgi:hypothetical protein
MSRPRLACLLRGLLTAAVIVFLAPPTLAQPLLSLDFGDRDGAGGAGNPLQSGFQAFLLDNAQGNTAIVPNTTRTFGSISVTVSSTGANTTGVDDRVRGVPTDSGAFTNEGLLRDFIFAVHAGGTAVATDEGLNVQIQGLTPNLAYTVRLWSYDNGSNPARVSDWFVNNGATPVVAGYSFTGSTLPTDNDSNTFAFLATADAAGSLLLSGRAAASVSGANSNNTHNVFLNALQITPIPEPSPLALVGGAFSAALAWGRRPRRAGWKPTLP